MTVMKCIWDILFPNQITEKKMYVIKPEMRDTLRKTGQNHQKDEQHNADSSTNMPHTYMLKDLYIVE